MNGSVVVLICAGSEWRASQPFLPEGESGDTPFGAWRAGSVPGVNDPVIFTHTGWGKIAAAAAAQHAIDRWSPRLLINIGTCGGFEGEVEQGEIVMAERTVVYDIIELMGDRRAAVEHYTVELDLAWCDRGTPIPVRRAPLVSADRDLHAGEIFALGEEHGAIAGDWESGAIAWTATRNGVPILVLRGVSDLVSATGGEAYGAAEVFVSRCPAIMERLVASLPEWIAMFDAAQT
jgi:adenosylhomocysteine nucleosidase